jgi:hypothetical protein
LPAVHGHGVRHDRDKNIHSHVWQTGEVMTHDNTPVTSEGNVTKFKPRETPKPKDDTRCIFLCGACECRTFNMYDDGTIACSYCDAPLRESEGMESQWRRCTGPVPLDKSTIPKESAGAVNVHQLGDVNFARNSVAKNVEKWAKNGHAVIIGAYHQDGASSWWFGVETEEQRRWSIRKMGDIIKHLKNMVLDMPNTIGVKDQSSDGA